MSKSTHSNSLLQGAAIFPVLIVVLFLRIKSHPYYPFVWGCQESGENRQHTGLTNTININKRQTSYTQSAVPAVSHTVIHQCLVYIITIEYEEGRQIWGWFLLFASASPHYSITQHLFSLLCRWYADLPPPRAYKNKLTYLSNCLQDIKSWMAASFLQLNENKTVNVLLFGQQHMTNITFPHLSPLGLGTRVFMIEHKQMNQVVTFSLMYCSSASSPNSGQFSALLTWRNEFFPLISTRQWFNVTKYIYL